MSTGYHEGDVSYLHHIFVSPRICVAMPLKIYVGAVIKSHLQVHEFDIEDDVNNQKQPIYYTETLDGNFVYTIIKNNVFYTYIVTSKENDIYKKSFVKGLKNIDINWLYVTIEDDE